MSAEPHEVLRDRPPVELMGALLAAIVDRHGGDPLRCCYTLIAVAATMAEHLPREDQLSAALEMHRVAIDMLPPPKRFARPQVEARASNVIKFAGW